MRYEWRRTTKGYGVFDAMQEAGVVLCIHGEEHGLQAEDYFDRNRNAEHQFYTEQLPM